MPDEPLTVLLIEGKADHARRISQHLQRAGGEGLEVESRHQLAAALARLGAGGVDAVVMNYRLPDSEDGGAAILEVANKAPAAPLIVISSRTGDEFLQRAMENGADDFLVKQKVTGESLLQAIQLAIARKKRAPAPADSGASGKEKESQIRAIINASMDCIIAMDAEGKILQFNPAAEDTFKYSAKEVIGKDLGELFLSPDVRERQRLSIERFISTGEASMINRRLEIPAFRKNGEQFITEMATKGVRLDGKFVFTIFLRDISERKRAEKEINQAEELLRKERDLLRTLMDHLPDLIFAKDAEGRFITVNAEMLQTLGVKSPNEVIGKTDYDFFSHEMADHFRGDDRKIIGSGKPMKNIEEEVPDAKGNSRWVLTTKAPLRNRQGKTEGLVGICRDITERKQWEVELENAKNAAVVANRAKSDFLAIMSHEIRTPMNAIIGMTELLLDTDLTDSQREYLKMVQDSGDALLMLINDILDFSKIEAGKLELDQTPFKLHESVGETLKTLAVRAHGKGLELACRLSPQTPKSLVGDPNRLRQIIVNLAGNAIKFTEQGEVVLRVESESSDGASPDPSASSPPLAASNSHSQKPPSSDGPEEVQLHFAISDTGPGISQNKLDKIFEAFEQEDTSTTRRFGGTGLGLAICRRLVELMGGRIWVESEVGQGSVFHFTARFQQVDEQPEEKPDPEIICDAPVLIVDDNATNRLIVCEMLRNWGMKPIAAASALEALQSLQASISSDQHPRLIITDVNMPDVDGFEFAERVRKDPPLSKMPMITLTSGDRPGDLKRCETLGISAHLLKPAHSSELFDAVLKSLRAAPTDSLPKPTSPTLEAPARPLRVLLAEDSIVNQKLAIGLLEKYGHQVTIANNGLEAVQQAQENEFDVVLMDVQMPEMDGLQATEAIRTWESETGQHVPIIAMTARAMKGDREKCLEAGMDDYISKPIRIKEVVEKLGKLTVEN